MINRRSLRIKAFKNLYSFESCKGANYLLGKDMLDKKFSPDLNSMEVVNKEELKHKKLLALESYAQQFDPEREVKDIHKEVTGEVKEAVQLVNNQNEADFRRLSKDLAGEAAKVSKDHLMILSLLEELAFQNKKLSDEKKSHTHILGAKAQVKTNLYSNRVCAKMKDDEVFQKLKQDYKINWSQHGDQLRDWYKGVLNKDEVFREYIQKESTDYAGDWAILDYICRGIVFKNDLFTSFFEDIDLDWSENQPIVRSLVLKTLKSVKEEPDELQMADISYNWEDDAAYVKELFKKTVKENDYLESLVKGKLQNWDIERVALTDKVLMKMAVAEMIHFPSIPTKVTINEFIEISKTFSTPKSKKFVNGILDGLAIDLVKQGVVQKSGRGLIDNK